MGHKTFASATEKTSKTLLFLSALEIPLLETIPWIKKACKAISWSFLADQWLGEPISKTLSPLSPPKPSSWLYHKQQKKQFTSPGWCRLLSLWFLKHSQSNATTSRQSNSWLMNQWNCRLNFWTSTFIWGAMQIHSYSLGAYQRDSGRRLDKSAFKRKTQSFHRNDRYWGSNRPSSFHWERRRSLRRSSAAISRTQIQWSLRV